MSAIQNFINGERVDAAEGRTTDLVDPRTGEVFAQAALSGEPDVDAAFRSAQRAFDGGWRDSTPSERQQALLKIADAIEERAEELVRIESRVVEDGRASAKAKRIREGILKGITTN